MAAVRCALVGLAFLPAALAAQGVGRDTVLAAGAHYRAGWVHRALLGAHHRTLWATPIRVPILDLNRFAGGLAPTRCGGRRQTKSLRFDGADRREYVLRSVDKDPTLVLPPELRATFVRDVIQDQISSAHPAGPLVVAPLLSAAGVLHAEPRLYVLPADPRIGAFDCVRPGLLGMLEERPTEGPHNEPAFAGAVELVGTAGLFERLERDPRHEVDSRALLAARLMDLYIGDWDRHQDQWRWARFDEGGVRRWRPIPRDRDQAFARLDGILVWLAGFYQPELVGFGDDYPSVWRLAWAARAVDRRLLVDLERPVWDSVTAAVRGRLTDSVVAAAVRQLPPELYALNGPDLERALRRRRDRLPEAAARFYAHLAEVVDVHATDEVERAEVERLLGEDGRTAVRLGRSAAAAPYYSRTFSAAETKEIRIHLHGGDDRLVVRGAGRGPLVRVIGGAGDDELADSSRSAGVRFYDDRGRNRFVSGPATSVNKSRFEPPPPDTVGLILPRDWGTRTVPLVGLSFAPDVGLYVGAGLMHTRYGFRALPHSTRWTLRGAYATSAATYRAALTGEFRRPAAPAVLTLDLAASGLEVLRFYGFGNETDASAPDSFYQIRQEQYVVAPAVTFPLAPRIRLGLGPVVKYARTDDDPATLLGSTGRFYGAGDFGQLGGQAALELDTRDARAAASTGVHVQVVGTWYAVAWDVRRPFATVRGTAATYLSVGDPPAGTLALRVGGAALRGTIPFHEVAYVGGATTVRGYPEQRFAGGPSLYANTELRLWVGRFHIILPGDFGVFGLADAGRVYLDGESSDRWHGAAGGGLWFAFLHKPANTISVAAAKSPERTALYVRAGFMF